MSVRYITVADTAKLVRQALAEEFPGVKFSVRSKSYSGGASIDVYWTDGPRTAVVEPVVKAYEGGDFDGSIDMAIRNESWLNSDGSASHARSRGTEGSMGSLPAYDKPAPQPEAELVHFGADYVFCNRTVSDFEQKEVSALKLIRERCTCIGPPPNDMFGNDYVTNLARMVVRDVGGDEQLEKSFERIVLRR